jgi:hypothetical protein
MIIGYAQKTALVSIAALFLATGSAHADPANQSNPSDIEGPMRPAPQDETGNPTEIPCAELGVAYDCGQSAPGSQAGEPDEVWINHGHIYSLTRGRLQSTCRIWHHGKAGAIPSSVTILKPMKLRSMASHALLSEDDLQITPYEKVFPNQHRCVVPGNGNSAR